MSWFYQDTELLGVPEGYIGFVYEITNTVNGRKYIGKKGFFAKVNKPPLAGQKRRRVSYKESNWRDYFGSNGELQADVTREGDEHFHRKVLRLCKSKGEMSYYEAKEQFARDVLLDPEYYNGWVSVKVSKTHLK